MSEGKYHVILADPPWSFSAWNPKTVGKRHVSHMYETLTDEQILSLPIAEKAADNAALFLWVTFPNLLVGIRAIEAWGFTYKTAAFTWVKSTKLGVPATGMGYYTRSNAEMCLLGIKGRMRPNARDVAQVIVAPRREHSQKPDEQYGRIMRLFDGPYLELFARQQWPGWDTAFSNQGSKFPAQPFLWGVQAS